MSESSMNEEKLEVQEPEAIENIEEKGQAEVSESETEPVDEVQMKLSSLEESLAKAEAQAAEYLDGWQRSRAEYANARKRLERERAEAYSRAAIDYAAKMLPIIDDLNLALANVPAEIGQNDWFEGLSLVTRKMGAILDDLKVEKIDVIGQPFDPTMHEALSLTSAEGFESGTIVEEIQSGYRIGDKVIRPALVNVAA